MSRSRTPATPTSSKDRTVAGGQLGPGLAPEGAVTGGLGGDDLPPAWVAAGRWPSEVVTRMDGGWRVLTDGSEPVFFGRRQEHLFTRVRARLEVIGTGGLS